MGFLLLAQLIADSYMRMGLLDMEPAPPNAYSPGTWSIEDPTRLPLIAPAALGPNINVTWANPS